MKRALLFSRPVSHYEDGRRGSTEGSADRDSLRSCTYCCRPASRVWALFCCGALRAPTPLPTTTTTTQHHYHHPPIDPVWPRMESHLEAASNKHFQKLKIQIERGYLIDFHFQLTHLDKLSMRQWPCQRSAAHFSQMWGVQVQLPVACFWAWCRLERSHLRRLHLKKKQGPTEGQSVWPKLGLSR